MSATTAPRFRLRSRLAFLLGGATAALLTLLPAAPAQARPPALTNVQLVDAFPDVEFKEPIHVTNGHDGSDWLYVVEQPGTIQRIRKFRGVGPVPQPSLFLDLRSKVYARSQGGLLCMACHPKFATNHLFYVSYLAKNPTPGPQDLKFKLVVAEYRSLGAKADPSSARVVIEVPKKTAQHQAGCIGFGPDGMLYLSIGDGNESKNDQAENAQNPRMLLGKILRIDPSGRQPAHDGQPAKGYSIPNGNPWPHNPGVRPEIWAFGFRNPWRFCWDPQGRMWVTEPGSSGPLSREWVQQVKYAGNHGWPFMEGTRQLKAPPKAKNFVPPAFEYVRGNEGATAGIGGVVYRGDRCKGMRGKYIFGDYMRGTVFCIDLTQQGNRVVGTNYRTVGDVPDLVSFGEDEQGEIYICANEMGAIFTMAPKP
jgi:glucose/arabinose dehydrogenase